MKFSKLFIFITIFAFFSVNKGFCVDNKVINADIGTKRIPAGTILQTKLLNPVGSSLTQAGEPFNAMIVEDVKVDKSIILPTGSVIRGSVSQIQSAKILCKGATIYLNFDHIVSPTGRQVPLNVGLCNNQAITIDGGLSSKTSYKTATVKNAQTTKKIVTNTTTWGWETGDNVLGGYPKYALAPACAVVSVPVAGIYFLGGSVVNVFKKGDEININQGDILQLMLVKPLDIPAN